MKKESFGNHISETNKRYSLPYGKEHRAVLARYKKELSQDDYETELIYEFIFSPELFENMVQVYKEQSPLTHDLESGVSFLIKMGGSITKIGSRKGGAPAQVEWSGFEDGGFFPRLLLLFIENYQNSGIRGWQLLKSECPAVYQYAKINIPVPL